MENLKIIKIKPITGFKKITGLDWKENLNKWCEKVVEIFKEKGVKEVNRDKIYWRSRKCWGSSLFLKPDPEYLNEIILRREIIYIEGKFKSKVRISFYFPYGPWLWIEYYEKKRSKMSKKLNPYESIMEREIYFVMDFSSRYCCLYIANSSFEDTIKKLFKYFENCYKNKVIDLKELIEIFAQYLKELKEGIKPLKDGIEKVNEIIETKKEIKDIPIIRECLTKLLEKNREEFREIDDLFLKYPYDGWIFPIENKLKFISFEEIENYDGKKEEKVIINYDFYTNKIEQEKLYIYEEIEKIKIPIEEEIEEKEQKTPLKEFSLNDFKNELKSIEKFNIFYPDEVIEEFYAAINSGNKFVIIAGPTGTGKTLLGIIYPVARYGELSEIAKSCKDQKELKDKLIGKDYICFIRIQPNWTSPKDIIGYYNPIKGEFVKGQLYDFLIKANENSDNEYFLILDEMNLSHPEHYLSDILSAMETGGKINISGSESIPFPKNISIIGTINIDETTKELSPRLKSRAFLVELRVDFDNYIKNCKDENKKEVAEILKIIDENLKEIELGVGYRDIEHISEFIKNGGNIDDGLIQKIIPRIRTTDEKFPEVAKNIIERLKNKKVDKFIEKLEKLKNKFELQEFI
jgi:hypothetical protein